MGLALQSYDPLCPAHQALLHNHLGVAQYLLSLPASSVCETSHGSVTPSVLRRLCGLRNHKHAQDAAVLLLDAGLTQLDETDGEADTNRATALVIAAKMRNFSLCGILLRHGACASVVTQVPFRCMTCVVLASSLHSPLESFRCSVLLVQDGRSVLHHLISKSPFDALPDFETVQKVFDSAPTAALLHMRTREVVTQSAIPLRAVGQQRCCGIRSLCNTSFSVCVAPAAQRNSPALLGTQSGQ